MTVMDWLPEEFHLAVLRLARADQKAFELAQVALAWSRGDGDRGALELQQLEVDADTLEAVVSYVRPVPPDAWLLFSEAIHHLRAAIDNIVFTIVERDHGSVLTDKQVRRISMLVSADQAGHTKATRDLEKAGLPEFLAANDLGERIARLQPFADQAEVHAMPPHIAALMAVPSTPTEHPLVLLRDYSNGDKHHSIRVAAGRTLVQRHDQLDRSRKAGMRPVEVGTVLETVPKNKRTEIDIMPALHLQRPGGSAWVGPMYELDQIARHVTDTVVPTLITGSPKPDGLPVNVHLSDNGQTHRERLVAGTTDRAHDRGKAAAGAAYLDSLTADERMAVLAQRPRVAGT